MYVSVCGVLLRSSALEEPAAFQLYLCPSSSSAQSPGVCGACFPEVAGWGVGQVVVFCSTAEGC